jgi:hypothetical protein
MSVFPLLYNIYTHIYTLSRIKEITLIRREKTPFFLLLQQITTYYLLYALGVKGNSLPHSNFGGRELPTYQCRFNIITLGGDGNSIVRGWFCLVFEKQVGRSWIVKVSDRGIPDKFSGWICDCGGWTWGDSFGHKPIFTRIKGRVVHGRLLDR